ncbi:MAG: cytochrome P450 [Candidatus Nanopelagicales bacterium]
MASTVTDRIDEARAAMDAMRVKQPKMPRPAGPSGLRVMWDLTRGRKAPYEVFAGMADQNQPVVHTRLQGEHVHVLFSPEAIWDVFVKNGRHTRKSLALQLTRPLLGNGLLTAEGSEHLRHRRAIQPMFHSARLAEYVQDMVAAGELTSAGWSDGQQIDVAEAMSELTLDVIGRTIFGVDLRSEAPDVADALSTVLAGFGKGLGPLASPMSKIPTPRRNREIAAIETLDRVVDDMIARRRAAVADGEVGHDLLTMLMTAVDDEGQPAFTAEEVRDEAMTLVLAGHETTALTLTWAWHLLSHHPEQLAWLHEELDGLANPPHSFADLANVPRTYAVIAESLRLYPPAWIVGRWLDADMRVSGWDLPRGSVVLASQYAMHRDPRFWPGALEFRPQRWIGPTGAFDERVPGVPRGVWFPFGFSTRRCIGEHFAWTEAVVILAMLARSWKVDVQVPEHIPMQSAITLRPAIPMPALVFAR